VLIVDDERFFREAIAEALEAAGIEHASAANGEEALRLAREGGIGAVVLDLGLPGLGGIEVLRRLRGSDPQLRVVTLAGRTEQDAVLEALRLGASDYLAKPLHDEELVLSVRRALEAHAALAAWSRLRRRLATLEARMAEIAVAARDAEGASRARSLAPLVAESIARVLDARVASLMLFDPASGLLRVAAQQGRDLPLADLEPVPIGEGVAGLALARGEAIAVEDVRKDPRFAGREPDRRYATHSFAVVPIAGPADPVGVLCATDRSEGPAFGDEDLGLLRMLALELGVLLGDAGPAPAARAGDRPDPLEAVAPLASAGDLDADLAREVCEAISSEVDPERMFSASLGPVARTLDAAPVSLYLIDPARGELVLERQCETRISDRRRLPRECGLTGVVLQTGWLVATGHPESDPRFDARVDTAADGVPRPLLCVPLRVRGKVLGLLRAFPSDPAAAAARTGEVLAAVFSAAARSALLYRSLVQSIDEVAEARRSARGTR